MRFACAAMTAAIVVAAPVASFAAKSSGSKAASTSSAKKNTYRQYTGYVTSLDKTSITVEKRGEKPQSKVFVKDDEMRTTGDVAKDARVTVYYRDDGGKAVAHRVVVKNETSR
jgi:hypothetical protein